jgi:hypothetical protein
MLDTKIETTDIVQVLREGSTWKYVPEQERNFDNKTIPNATPLLHKGTTVIDGQKYNIVDYR